MNERVRVLSSMRRLNVRPDVPVSGCGRDGRHYMRGDSERVQSRHGKRTRRQRGGLGRKQQQAEGPSLVDSLTDDMH